MFCAYAWINDKQRCPLSPTLFELYSDELEQMLTKFIKERYIKEVTIRNESYHSFIIHR